MNQNYHNNRNVYRLFATLLAVFLLGLASSSALAQSVMLGWNADTAPGVAGYRFYYGVASGQYTQQLDVGNSTTVTLSNLAAGTYYCVVTAYDASDVESLPSNETSFTVSAAVSPTLPLAVDDDVAIYSNAPVAIAVLANDNPPTGGSLTVVSVTQPAAGTGTAAINVDGTITFTPGSAFNGEASFTYTVSDGAGDTGVATVTVTNPYVADKGGFAGLVTNSSPQETNVGVAQFRLLPTGSFTGRVVVGKYATTVAGSFGTTGQFTKVVTIGGQAATITLSVDAANDSITGTVAIAGGSTSTISAGATPYSAANPAPQAGAYTALFQPQSQNSGYGFARITVAATGAVKFSGKLASGGAVNASTSLGANGTFPLSVRIAGSRYVGGLVSFQNITTTGSQSDLTASLMLISATGAQSSLNLVGSAYVAPATLPPAAALALPQTSANASFDLSGGGLSNQIVKAVTLTSLNQIIVQNPGADKLSTTVNATTGLFTGRFYDASNRKTRTFQGVLFQKRACGAGYFTGLNGSGAVTLTGNTP